MMSGHCSNKKFDTFINLAVYGEVLIFERLVLIEGETSLMNTVYRKKSFIYDLFNFSLVKKERTILLTYSFSTKVKSLYTSKYITSYIVSQNSWECVGGEIEFYRERASVSTSP